MAVDQAAYIKEWRKTETGRESLSRQKRRAKAKARALADLAERHVAEYEALFAGHLQQIEAEASLDN